MFELCLRAVGISFADLPLSEAFLGWAIGRVITSLPLTPGGIGVVELGMIGTLVGFGASHAHVVAAVLLYRGLIVLPTLVIGLVVPSSAAPAGLGAGRARVGPARLYTCAYRAPAAALTRREHDALTVGRR